jgi:hypothetical protein
MRVARFGLELAQFGEGALELAAGGVAAAAELFENVRAFGVLKVDGAQGELTLLGGESGESEVDDFGFDPGVAAFQPDGLNEVGDEPGFDEAGGVEAVFKLPGEFRQFVGVFAGEDGGLGIESEFDCVAGRDGLPLG